MAHVAGVFSSLPARVVWLGSGHIVYTVSCRYASVRRIADREKERVGLKEIIDKAIEEIAREAGDSFNIGRMNLTKLSRRTGLARSRAELKAFSVESSPMAIKMNE